MILKLLIGSFLYFYMCIWIYLFNIYLFRVFFYLGIVLNIEYMMFSKDL